ncbi:MAG TPA: hypothetical protein VFF64_01305 [Candidatus Eremiobacteraceae bacterium]|nr:hypothetical protein [Candidatus Eremiobacteraceae bacterium]
MCGKLLAAPTIEQVDRKPEFIRPATPAGTRSSHQKPQLGGKAAVSPDDLWIESEESSDGMTGKKNRPVATLNLEIEGNGETADVVTIRVMDPRPKWDGLRTLQSHLQSIGPQFSPGLAELCYGVGGRREPVAPGILCTLVPAAEGALDGCDGLFLIGSRQFQPDAAGEREHWRAEFSASLRLFVRFCVVEM